MQNTETTAPLMAEFAWDGDRLTTTDEAKIKKIVRKNLSASASNSLRGCTARFAADSVLPRIEDPFSPAELGTGAHAVLEELYALPEAERTKENLVRISLELADKEWTPDKLSRHTVSTNSVNGQVKQEWEARVRAMAEGDFLLEDPTKVDVFQPEWALRGVLLPVPDGRVIPMIGFIDRTDFTPEGKLAIRDYKGLALDTPIPTTRGWVTVGELAVGDEVFAPSGKRAKVTLKSEIHNRPCYELTFSDGSKVVSDHVHDWVVYGPDGEETIEAQHLHAWFQKLSGEGKTRQFSVKNTGPVEFDVADLPIDPYILGAWLGDGTSKNGDISVSLSDADAMTAELARRWEGDTSWKNERDRLGRISLRRANDEACLRGHVSDRRAINGSCVECEKTTDRTRTNADLSWKLAELGVKRNKHIPDAYLFASVEQRIELVRGLMDTDGSWNSTRNRAVFVNTNTRIVETLFEVLTSLGVTVQRSTVAPKKAEHKQSFRLEFTPAVFNPFSIPRKAEPVDEFRASFAAEQKNGVPAKAYRRVLMDIREVPSVPTQCIKVDAPEEMFLCGRAFVPTHNTGKYKAPNPRFSDDYGDQLRIYTVTAETVLQDPELRKEHFSEAQLMRLDEAGHYSVDDAKLLYIAAGKERTIDINRRALDVTMDGFARSWDTMQAAGAAGEFKATPGALCGWCPLANACPVATIKTDKARAAAATQPTAVMLGIPTVRPSGTATNVVESKKAESVPASNGTDVKAPVQPVQKEGKMPLLPDGVRYAEDSSYKEFVNYPDGARPNLNSYGFGGASGLTSLAFELLSERNALSTDRIIALSVTLGKLVWLVERRVANGAFNWNHGLHTRLRGNLRTVITQHPLPINGTADDWKAWVALAAEHMADLIVVTYQLIETDFTDDAEAYKYLASDGDMAPHVDLPRRFLPDGVAYVEGKVYDESALYSDGSRPNVNSHGFAGASGVVSEAYRLLHESNEVDYTASNLIALSATLGHVLWLAEVELVDAFSWHHGLNTRLRGFLFEVLKNASPTLNQPVAAWAKWEERVANQLKFFGETSYSLYNTDFAGIQEPYGALTGKKADKA